MKALALRLTALAEERRGRAVPGGGNREEGSKRGRGPGWGGWPLFSPFKELIGLGREAAVEHAERALADLLVQRDDGLLDAVAEAVAPDDDVARLPEPVDPPRRLHLLRRLWRRKSGESSTMGRVEVGCEGRASLQAAQAALRGA